jgi:hypothetical protein
MVSSLWHYVTGGKRAVGGAVPFKEIIYTTDPSPSYPTDANVACPSFHINSRSAEFESASVMGLCSLSAGEQGWFRVTSIQGAEF